MGTPLPSGPQPEGLQKNWEKGSERASPVRSALRATSSDLNHPYPLLPARMAPLTTSLVALPFSLVLPLPTLAGATRVTQGGGRDPSCTNTGESPCAPQNLAPLPPQGPESFLCLQGSAEHQGRTLESVTASSTAGARCF